ncbi:MAG TPA: HAMP domain-containing sensor histidine kinase [Myxococcales bacterium]|jgi:two-component system C4-dicarboxylate transport sensor histidine kinase DctB|nr:HAMP domain-containing sensor histidine kinase [Myxococcales bacterium]
MNEPDHRDLIEEAEPLAPGLIHEIRHPLMGILAGLELLARRIPSVSGTQEWQLLNEQAARIDELLRTYQDLFAGGPVQRIPFSVDETVRRAVSLLSPRIRKLGASFSLEAAAAPAVAVGAAPLLVHAVTNLLANALDAVEECGTPGGRVQVRVLPAPGRVQVRVSDEGTGIPDAVRPHLFQPRFTTKPQGKGTGLGLHLARTAMERSGGELHLVDAEDPSRASWARTEFAISLPSAGGAQR